MSTRQKETPVSGGNHTAGVNTQITGPIVADAAPPSNLHMLAFLNDKAQATRVTLLKRAANFASLHAPHTLWKREMGSGAAKVIVRLEWPGVLAVYDPRTGDKLAQSAPGQPEILQKQ